MVRNISKILRKIMLGFGLAVLLSAKGFAQYPTDSAQVYLMTASPGTEVYAAFGHTALRVADRSRGLDVVYNYGMFNFETPNFTMKFIYGRLLYFLAVDHNFNEFLQMYRDDGQAMYQQRLNLTNKEKLQLISNLQRNNQPENRYYRYNFFRDNCSTRVRDIIERSVDGKLVYDSSSISRPESFRQLIDPFMSYNRWEFFGTNLILGKAADSSATVRERMFLPQHLMNIFAHSKVQKSDTLYAIAEATVQLFPATVVFEKSNPATSPVAIGWMFFALVTIYSLWGFLKKRHSRWFDVTYFILTGVLGTLIFSLLVASLHSVLTFNYNIVWASPVNLLIAIGILAFRKKVWFRYLLLMFGVELVMFVMMSFFMSQQIPAAAYPFIGVMIVRISKNLLQL
jgi:hypothetical protein